jgi:hypothetical protein
MMVALLRAGMRKTQYCQTIERADGRVAGQKIFRRRAGVLFFQGSDHVLYDGISFLNILGGRKLFAALKLL